MSPAHCGSVAESRLLPVCASAQTSVGRAVTLHILSRRVAVFTRLSLKKQNPGGTVAISSFPLWGKAGMGATRKDSGGGREKGSPPAGEGATTFLRKRRVLTGAWNALKKLLPSD